MRGLRGPFGRGTAEVWEAASFDVARAALEAFAAAAAGGDPYPIPVEQMIHGVAVTEAIVRSSTAGLPETVA